MFCREFQKETNSFSGKWNSNFILFERPKLFFFTNCYQQDSSLNIFFHFIDSNESNITKKNVDLSNSALPLDISVSSSWLHPTKKSEPKMTLKNITDNGVPCLYKNNYLFDVSMDFNKKSEMELTLLQQSSLQQDENKYDDDSFLSPTKPSSSILDKSHMTSNHSDLNLSDTPTNKSPDNRNISNVLNDVSNYSNFYFTPTKLTYNKNSNQSLTPTNYDDPFTNFDNPPTTFDNPPTTFDNPSTTLDSPLTTLDNPSTTLDNPLTTLDNPLTTLDNPPTTLDNPPTTLDNPPTTLDNPPTTLDNPSTTLDNPPTTLDNLPTTLENPSTTLDNPPTTLDNLPTLDNSPIVHDSLSTSFDNSPTTLDNLPNKTHPVHPRKDSFFELNKTAGIEDISSWTDCLPNLPQPPKVLASDHSIATEPPAWKAMADDLFKEIYNHLVSLSQNPSEDEDENEDEEETGDVQALTATIADLLFKHPTAKASKTLTHHANYTTNGSLLVMKRNHTQAPPPGFQPYNPLEEARSFLTGLSTKPAISRDRIEECRRRIDPAQFMHLDVEAFLHEEANEHSIDTSSSDSSALSNPPSKNPSDLISLKELQDYADSIKKSFPDINYNA